MAESARGASGRIFLNYRREETAYATGWLYDRLAERFGGGQIFKDVDSIELGDDFVDVITAAVGSCDVLLAIIGDQWVRSSTEITPRSPYLVTLLLLCCGMRLGVVVGRHRVGLPTVT